MSLPAVLPGAASQSCREAVAIACMKFSTEPLVQLAKNLLGGVRNERAGAEYCCRAVRFQKTVVLRRNDATDDHHDVFATELFEFFRQLHEQRLVSAGKRTDADDMHVVLD